MDKDFKEIKKLFGAKIKEYRKRAGLTQEKLAERADCSWQTISGMETGYSFPSSTVLVNLSIALGVPISSLFNFDDKKAPDENEAELMYLFKRMSPRQKNLALKLMRAVVSEE